MKCVMSIDKSGETPRLVCDYKWFCIRDFMIPSSRKEKELFLDDFCDSVNALFLKHGCPQYSVSWYQEQDEELNPDGDMINFRLKQ